MTSVVDILGAEGGAGSPAQIRTAAAQLEDASSTAAHVRSGIAQLDAASWTGTAADVYRDTRDTALPPELDRLRSSFDRASRALAVYAGQLEALQDQARALAKKRDAAVASLSAAQTRETSARKGVAQAKSARGRAADPASAAQADAAVTGAQRAAASATAARETAAKSVSQIDGQASALRDALKVAARSCEGGLHAASDAGIQDSLFSGLERWKDTNPFAQTLIEPVFHFVASAITLGEATGALLLNPSFENLDKVAEAYSNYVEALKPILHAVSVAVLVVVAAVVVFGSGGTAALPMLVVAQRVLWATDAALDGTKTLSDMYLVDRGRKPSSVLVQDAISLGLDAVTVGGITKPASSIETYLRTGSPQAKGMITRQVYANAASRDAVLRGELESVSTSAVKDVAGYLNEQVWGSASAVTGELQGSGPAGPVIGPFNGVTQGSTSQIRLSVTSTPAQPPLQVVTAP